MTISSNRLIMIYILFKPIYWSPYYSHIREIGRIYQIIESLTCVADDERFNTE